MFKIVKPEIDGKWSFRDGMTININSKFQDESSVLERLKIEDASPVSLNYNENLKPKYRFTKYYLNFDKNEIITERVFYINETSTWFGVTDWRHGQFHLYRRMLSKFTFVRKTKDTIGIFYKYDSGQIVAYSTDDCAATENCVNWIFNNPDQIKSFMQDNMQMYNTYKETPYLGPVGFYTGSNANPEQQ